MSVKKNEEDVVRSTKENEAESRLIVQPFLQCWMGIQIVPYLLSRVGIQMCLGPRRWRSMLEQPRGCR